MFGTLRFILASLVVVNHAGLLILGVKPGPASVVGFYIISGYVVSFLVDFKIRKPLLKSFYMERFFRIYPQFLFHLVVAVIFILGTGHISRFSEIRPNFISIVTNLTLLPLQLRAFSDYLTQSLYVPTSWSLSLEVSFYAMAPFLLRFRAMDVVAILSFGVFFGAIMGFIPPQPHTFSYATIIGTLHFFLVGAWLQRREYKKVWTWIAAMTTAALAITAGASWQPAHIQEVIIGGLLGIAIIATLSRVNAPLYKPIDDLLGRISYPVFLNHFLFIWAWEYMGQEVETVSNQTAILMCSWAFGLIAFIIVEKPLDAYRRGLRTV